MNSWTEKKLWRDSFDINKCLISKNVLKERKWFKKKTKKKQGH